jgi:hypothetical protein
MHNSENGHFPNIFCSENGMCGLLHEFFYLFFVRSHSVCVMAQSIFLCMMHDSSNFWMYIYIFLYFLQFSENYFIENSQET